MDRKLELVFRNVKSTPELESLVQERVERLEHLYQHITGCRVTVTLQNQAHRSNNIPDVHIDVQVPGQNLIVNHRHPAGDALTAIHMAFDAVALQLKEYKARRIGNVKQHDLPADRPEADRKPVETE
ncbi:MAG TPA: HPF/RaiA family ribosome-associated protein [Rhizomicrobium sp.]|nr:HPF/RaiA family ribosome-associated protein [Rhizomicrobium sp.]